MKKKSPPKIPEFRLNYKIWLSTPEGEGILGDGKWRILKLIEEKGSLKAACEALGYTYRRTWGNLKRIEKILGFPLLEKQRGGIDGGRTYLSPEGKKLVQAFDTFHSRVDMTIQEGFAKLMDDLKDI
ncbi:MAG: LysR family transcriptional regulator [Bacteroidetes bacterium]|nr:LysR family transcriptional regulator [Bacteroidota bacterium]